MSVGPNIIANYASQLYTSALAIVLVPLYVHYMGVEAYGLVGFYAMLQGWFLVLDMGVSATLSRQAARFNAGAVDALSLRRLVRAFEGIFRSSACAVRWPWPARRRRANTGCASSISTCGRSNA